MTTDADLLTPERIQHDLALAETVSAGPWYVEGIGGIQMDGIRDGYNIASSEYRKIASIYVSNQPRVQKHRDAELIAAARDGYPAALREVQRLQLDNSALEATRMLSAALLKEADAKNGLLEAENERLQERLLAIRTCLEVHEGRWQVRAGWSEEFWGSIAEALEGANDDL